MSELHKACREGDLQRVTKLLDQGANIDGQEHDGTTVLMAAVGFGNVEIVKELLKRGADLEVSQVKGRRALHVAAEFGHYETALELMRQGANIEARDIRGMSVVHYASTARDFFRSKEKPYEIHIRDKDEMRNGRLKILQELLERGAEVDPTTDVGRTPLHIAAYYGLENLRSINVLIKHGACLESRDNLAGSTPLHAAMFQNDMTAIEALLEAGADSEAKDNHGETAIDYAQHLGHKEAVDTIRGFQVKQAAEKRNESKKGQPCSLCQKVTGLIKFVPCGHSQVCRTCCQNWTHCHNCKALIQDKVGLVKTESAGVACAVCLTKPQSKTIILDTGPMECCNECSDAIVSGSEVKAKTICPKVEKQWRKKVPLPCETCKPVVRNITAHHLRCRDLPPMKRDDEC